jgi:ADYC domain-containing protein
MRDLTSSGWLHGACILAVVAGTGSSCHVEKTNEKVSITEGTAGRTAPLCLADWPHPEPMKCPITSCGNSAKIYDSILEALDVRGVTPQPLVDHHFRLLRGTLKDAGGGCGGVSDLSLEVRDGGFVGVAGGLVPNVKCSGRDLVNASFQVEKTTLAGTRTEKLTIQIADMQKVPVWRGDNAPPADLPTYDLVYTPTAPIPGVQNLHLCSPSSWDAHDIDLPGRPNDWNMSTPFAVLIQGETYHADATVQWTGANWFNIGCAGAGITKMRLLGFDPMNNRTPGDPVEPNSGKSTPEERQATLKMITAKYCGPDSWTKTGTRILLRRGNENPELAPSDPSERVGPVESRWGGNGALCISHLRAWTVGSKCAERPEPPELERLHRDCNVPACDENPPVTSAGPAMDSATVWSTRTMNHVSHTNTP